MPYKDPEKQKEHQREWLQKRKAEWFADKSCVVCGSTENLELDHIDESQKVSHNIWSWSQVRREKELSKCQALCRKHHREKTNLYLSMIFSKPVVHGSQHTYDNGCRCQLCKSWLIQHWRLRRGLKDITSFT